jgi:hypothetical protein
MKMGSPQMEGDGRKEGRAKPQDAANLAHQAKNKQDEQQDGKDEVLMEIGTGLIGSGSSIKAKLAILNREMGVGSCPLPAASWWMRARGVGNTCNNPNPNPQLQPPPELGARGPERQQSSTCHGAGLLLWGSTSKPRAWAWPGTSIHHLKPERCSASRFFKYWLAFLRLELSPTAQDGQRQPRRTASSTPPTPLVTVYTAL